MTTGELLGYRDGKPVWDDEGRGEEQRMTKHTPGPWYVGGNNGYADMAASITTDTERIAFVCANPRGYDNANLIAAAPAMLAALEEISALLDASPSEGVTQQQRAIARGAALVAIRAARGEQVGTETR